MLFKLIVVLFLIMIFYSLGSGLFYLVRGDNESTKVAKALTWRIGLSLFLFLLILFCYAMGWVAPHGI